MKRPARILVVDDSVVARQLVCDSLGDDPAFEIVGTAHNGQSALHRVGHLRPDIVIMDIEMPVLDGLKTLGILRARDPLKPQVIILSRRSEREARIALEALSRGATDFVQKPIVETTADEAREVTGYAIGGTPPFGHRTSIPTHLDRAILDHEIVYGAAGTPDRCFPIRSTRLVEVTGAVAADFVV